MPEPVAEEVADLNHQRVGITAGTVEASCCCPSWIFLLQVVVAMAALGMIWVWPLVHVGRRREWAWFLAILAFGPVAFPLWFALARNRSPHVGSA